MWRRVWIRDRKGSRRTNYSIRWYGSDGRLHETAASSSRKIAEQIRRRKELEINSPEYSDTRAISLGDFAREHLALTAARHAARTAREEMDVLERLKTFCGKRQLSGVTPALLEAYLAERLAQVQPATANKELRTLKAVFTQAVKRGYLRKNPCDSLKPVRESEKDVRVLTLKEIDRLLEACPDLSWRTLVFLALTTGMRSGELRYLEWDDINLDSGIAEVRCKTAHRTKSRKNRQAVLVPAAVAMLKQMARGNRHGRWVFGTRSGRPRTTANICRRINKIVERAGIDRCTLHDLRRTFVSHLAMAGVNEAVVKDLAGHAAIQTTLKHYTRILPESLRLAPLRLAYVNPAIVANSYPKGEDGEAVARGKTA